eukprot:COSAG06_NODE_2492_length_6769_cov_2.361619_3_plen_115_part_00
MQGHNVLHPMGWDAFGLPAEQYAIETGTHPAATTASNIDGFREQLQVSTAEESLSDWPCCRRKRVQICRVDLNYQDQLRSARPTTQLIVCVLLLRRGSGWGSLTIGRGKKDAFF